MLHPAPTGDYGACRRGTRSSRRHTASSRHCSARALSRSRRRSRDLSRRRCPGSRQSPFPCASRLVRSGRAPCRRPSRTLLRRRRSDHLDSGTVRTRSWGSHADSDSTVSRDRSSHRPQQGCRALPVNAVKKPAKKSVRPSEPRASASTDEYASSAWVPCEHGPVLTSSAARPWRVVPSTLVNPPPA